MLVVIPTAFGLKRRYVFFLLPKMYFILSLLPTPNYPLSQLSISKLGKGSTFFLVKNEFYFHENKNSKLNRIHMYPCFTAKALAI